MKKKKKEKVWFVIWAFNRHRSSTNCAATVTKRILTKEDIFVGSIGSFYYAYPNPLPTYFHINFFFLWILVNKPYLCSAWFEPSTQIDRRSTWRKKNSHWGYDIRWLRTKHCRRRWAVQISLSISCTRWWRRKPSFLCIRHSAFNYILLGSLSVPLLNVSLSCNFFIYFFQSSIISKDVNAKCVCATRNHFSISLFILTNSIWQYLLFFLPSVSVRKSIESMTNRKTRVNAFFFHPLFVGSHNAYTY